MSKPKLPFVMFYTKDWLADEDLRRCSKAAKGVWVDILCLMAGCEERGVLATGGIAWSDEEIAMAVGGAITENLLALNELMSKGVAHRRKSGAVFSPRLVRDEQTRKERVKAGQKGGNPSLKSDNSKQGKAISENDLVNQQDNQPLKLVSDICNVNAVKADGLPELLNTPEFQEAWERWKKHRQEIGKSLKPTGAKQLLKKLASWGVTRAIAAIDHSIANSWQGCFEAHGEAKKPAEPPGKIEDLEPIIYKLTPEKLKLFHGQ